jgi:hypothetical protein
MKVHVAPARVEPPGARPTERKDTVDRSRVHHVDDTLEAHYASLERPCPCLDG